MSGNSGIWCRTLAPTPQTPETLVPRKFARELRTFGLGRIGATSSAFSCQWLPVNAGVGETRDAHRVHRGIVSYYLTLPYIIFFYLIF